MPNPRDEPDPYDLLLMVAHDVRSMAATMHGFAGLPAAESSNGVPSAQWALDRVRAISERLILMVEDLARTIMLQQNTSAGAADAVSPSELLESARLDVCGAAEARQQRIECVPPDPDAPRLADGAALRMALRNLLDNAIRHSPPGTRIRVAAAGDRDWFTLTVEDSGPGIPPERLLTLFDRPGSVEPQGFDRGMGLGLWMAKRLAQLHGGDVAAHSRPGDGSTFVLRVHAPLAGGNPVEPAGTTKP